MNKRDAFNFSDSSAMTFGEPSIAVAGGDSAGAPAPNLSQSPAGIRDRHKPLQPNPRLGRVDITSGAGGGGGQGADTGFDITNIGAEQAGVPEDPRSVNRPRGQEQAQAPQGQQEPQGYQSPGDLADILGNGGVGEDDPDEDEDSVEASKRKVLEMASKFGAEKTHKIEMGIVLIFVGVALVFMAIGGLRDKRVETRIAEVKPPYAEFEPKEVSIGKTVYADQIKIKKFARVENQSMQCFVKGKPKAFGSEIILPVSPAVYRAIENGDTIKITYQIITLNTDGETSDYVINAKVVTK